MSEQKRVIDKEYTPEGFFKLLRFAEKHGKEIKKEAIWHLDPGIEPWWEKKVFKMPFGQWTFQLVWNSSQPGYEEEFWVYKEPDKKVAMLMPTKEGEPDGAIMTIATTRKRRRDR